MPRSMRQMPLARKTASVRSNSATKGKWISMIFSEFSFIPISSIVPAFKLDHTLLFHYCIHCMPSFDYFCTCTGSLLQHTSDSPHG